MLSFILAIVYTAGFAAAVNKIAEDRNADAAKTLTLVYEVTGDSSDSLITYSTYNAGTSGSEQTTSSALPFSKSITVKKGGTSDFNSYSLIASNGSTGATIPARSLSTAQCFPPKQRPGLMHRPVAAELASSKTSDACAARSEVISRSGRTTRHSWVRLPYASPCRALSCQSAPRPVTYHGRTRLPCFRKRDVFSLGPLRCSSGCFSVCPQWSASASRITGGCPRRSISCRLPRSSCEACSPTGNSTVGNKKRVPTTIERSVSEINTDFLHWGAQAVVVRHY